MTDKEQIIINDIDVSECENFRPKDRFTCYPYIYNCHQKPNCYFKQLVRKTQECEELKRRVEGAILLGNSYKKDFEEQVTETKRYRKALEEIKNFTKKHCDY